MTMSSPLPRVTLKPHKDAPVLAGHPWIFSEALGESDTVEPGEIVAVYSARGQCLGQGTCNPLTSIRVRMLTLDPNERIDATYFAKRFSRLDAWKQSRLPSATTGYRVVHAEADGIPGLILDRYADTYVFQLHTAGMERLRAEIIAAIQQTFHPSAIVERSDLSVRQREGLHTEPIETHHGSVDGPVAFQEAGLWFFADVLKGQKTGFFLDQRDARLAVQAHARGKRVLNLFGYTGAFSVHAAKGGAAFVATVDVSRPALELAEQHLRKNSYNPDDEDHFLFLEADVLDLLRDPQIPGGPYDLIICDPPAFAKSEAKLPQAIKAYTELNMDCLRRLSPGGILVTSSCSGRVTQDDFRSLLRLAAGRTSREVRLLDWVTQPIDHAENLAFPEGRYLKTAILEVTGSLAKEQNTR